MIPTIFYYYKVPSKDGDLFNRRGKCPRGYEIDCHDCNHIKITDEQDRGDEFRCFDISMDTIEVRVYESPFIINGVQFSVTNNLLFTYRDSVLADIRFNIENVEKAYTMMDFIENGCNVEPVFKHHFYALYTTGQINVQFQEDKNC